ncbi:MAG TPA: four helix bundle protein [Patescibacteria group bacterium]|nr:four helix bundle protein [Patescibacteria group bacterium]
MKSYKELIVWQKSIELVVEIYRITSNFPKSELFGIVMQMRRAVVSIPSNIAEGFGRKTHKEKDQFYLISFGSGCELETQILISKKLSFDEVRDFEKADRLLDEVMRMLNKMTTPQRKS